MWRRAGEGWVRTGATGEGAVRLESLEHELSMDEIYFDPLGGRGGAVGPAARRVAWLGGCSSICARPAISWARSRVGWGVA